MFTTKITATAGDHSGTVEQRFRHGERERVSAYVTELTAAGYIGVQRWHMGDNGYWHHTSDLTSTTTADPRTPGSVYRSGYWGSEDYVSAMWTDVASRTVWVSVVGLDDAQTRHHCTAWDGRRGGDVIVTTPDDHPAHHACAECRWTGYRGDFLAADHYGRDDVSTRLCLAGVMPCRDHICYYA